MNLVDSVHGLQPTFLIAESRNMTFNSFSPRKRVGNRRRSTKRFGRRLAYTRPYEADSYPRPVSPSPPPSPLPYNPKPDWDEHKSKRPIASLVVGVGVLLLIKSLGIDWKASCEMTSDMWSTMWNYLIDVNCADLLCKFAEISGLPLVPMLWSAAFCMTLKGRDILRRWCPEDSWQDFEQESRTIRRCNEQWHNREYSRMKRQLTKQIREDFQRRSQDLCVDQNKRFNMMMQSI